MSQTPSHIHCIGIGGIGVSALAEIALARGAHVSGSDLYANEQTERLRQLGATIHIGHSAEHVQMPDLTVYSSAIRADNPERIEAERVSRTIRRGTLLAELMADTYGIGICGTHGKTTTSCLLAQLLTTCGHKPTVYLGGVPAGMKTHAWIGTGECFVAELDESDGSFLEAPVQVGIITNIEADHLDHYGSYEAVVAAFDTFAKKLPRDGMLVACVDDPGVRSLLKTYTGPCIRTGLSDDICDEGIIPDVAASDIRIEGVGSAFRLHWQGKDAGLFQLHLPGRHNIRNALGALGAALHLGVNMDALREALARCVPVQRRFEVVGTVKGITVVDDYAHHPTEIAATLQAARESKPARVIAVFQPHLYSRTQFLAEGFARSLAMADMVMLADIYPAREAPIPGVTSALIAEALLPYGHTALGPFPREEIVTHLAPLVQRGDMICFIGAGNIGVCARECVDALQG